MHLSDVHLVSVRPSDVWCCLSGLSWLHAIELCHRCSSHGSRGREPSLTSVYQELCKWVCTFNNGSHQISTTNCQSSVKEALKQKVLAFHSHDLFASMIPSKVSHQIQTIHSYVLCTCNKSTILLGESPTPINHPKTTLTYCAIIII